MQKSKTKNIVLSKTVILEYLFNSIIFSDHCYDKNRNRWNVQFLIFLSYVLYHSNWIQFSSTRVYSSLNFSRVLESINPVRFVQNGENNWKTKLCVKRNLFGNGLVTTLMNLSRNGSLFRKTQSVSPQFWSNKTRISVTNAMRRFCWGGSHSFGRNPLLNLFAVSSCETKTNLTSGHY